MNDFYPAKRIRIFFFICAALVAAVVLSYARLIFFAPKSYGQSSEQTVERGTIFDRNGKILAIQTTVYNLSATPSAISDKRGTSEILAPILGIPSSRIFDALSKTKGNFVYLKKKIGQAEHDDIQSAVKQHRLRGLRLEGVSSRIYPENELASQVIGFAGDGNKGLSGIEYSLENYLMPQEDSRKSTLYGDNIVLTLDASLQYKLEKIGQKSMAETQAESFVLLAADAKNGEILSYISLPAADLNSYPSARDAERTDRPAFYAYEPGSVFKLFSTAAFVDSGAVSAGETFLCDGIYDVRSTNGERVRITCLDHHGWITPQQALEYSCNDVLSQMSDRIDAEMFLKYIRNFGFGEKTGIELPGETKGSVKTTDSPLWSGRSKPTMSMGQELSVSALQMVQAMSAIANGGKPLQLTLISKIVGKDGVEKYRHSKKEKPAVISKSAADYILRCMASTARVGTGYRAALNDVQIGVKTGTAQMIDEKTGRYSQDDFFSSCMSVFPVEDPQIILFIVIAKAKGETYAGRIVAPVIQEAADEIANHLGMNRTGSLRVTHSGELNVPQASPAELGETVPNFYGMSKKQVAPLLERRDVNVVISGDGWARSQNPPAGTRVTEGMTIEIFFQ